MPLTSTTMCVADVHAPVVRERDQVGERRAVGLVRRIEHRAEACPTCSRYFFSASISGGKKSVRGPATTTTDASSGTEPLLREHQLLDGVVPSPSASAIVAVAVALRRRRVLLAVPLREIHLPLLAGHHLDDAVGDVLLVVGRDALGAALVVEDDRAGIAEPEFCLAMVGFLSGSMNSVVTLLGRVRVLLRAGPDSAGSPAPARTP